MWSDGLEQGGPPVGVLGEMLDRSGQDWVEGAGRAPEKFEYRRWERVPLSVPVSVRLLNGKERLGTTIDCSVGGIGLITTSPVSAESPVGLRLDLGEECIKVPAVVRYSRAGEDGHILGCELVNVPPRAHLEMVELVALQERRHAIRAQIQVPVRYRILSPDAEFSSTISTDVSAGGVRFCLSSPASIGERVELSMMIWGGRFSRVGTVIRLDTSHDSTWGVVCFDPVSTSEASHLGFAIQQSAKAVQIEEFLRREAEQLRAGRLG